MVISFILRWIIGNCVVQITSLYIIEKETQTMTINGLKAYSNVFIVESFSIYLLGLMRSMKISNKATIPAFICLTFISIPLAIYLSKVKKRGVMGIW